LIIEVKNSEVYIPKYNGNRNADEGEQIRLHHRYLKASERKKYIYTDPVKFDANSGKVTGEVSFHQDQEGLVRALVTKIEGLTLKDEDGKEVEIKTAAQLYDQPGVPQMLISEIESYMLNASPEVDSDFL